MIEYYDKGGVPNPHLSKEIRRLKLTFQERADLVACLRALTGDGPRVREPALPK